MKKFISYMLIIILTICTLFSCNNSNYDPGTTTDITTDMEDETNTDTTPESSTDVGGNETDQNTPTTPSPKNETATQSLSVEKYYKEIASNYERIAYYTPYEKVFFDDIFEAKKESQYKILASYSELQAFTLLNFDEVEENVFDNNYVVAILEYHIGPSGDGSASVGFYDANFKDVENAEIILDKFYKYDTDSTDDLVDIYNLYFIIVPKDEVEYTDEICSINVKANDLEQYDMRAYNIENTTEKTTAYYLKDKASKEKIEIFESASSFWPSYPCIAIHLDKVIETDFIVNNFKYENGEIYITIEIYQSKEMRFLHNVSANLIVVSLSPHHGELEINVPNYIPNNCKININLKNVK